MRLARRVLGLGHCTKTNIAIAIVLAAIGATAGSAAAEEFYYRNDIGLRTGPPSRFLIQVPASAATHGGYFHVVTDDQGRIARYTFLVDGKATSETAYQYSANAKQPHRVQSYRQGAMTGYTEITRDAAGQPTRLEYYTAQGKLTG